MQQRDLLLIEDDAHIAEALRFILSRAGWAVSVCGDGLQAVGQVSQMQPAVVVLDMMLPGRSGLDVLADLRADPGLKAVPVLVLSASGQSIAAAETEVMRAVGEGVGPTVVMTKPFSNAAVLAAVQELAGG